MLGWWYAVWYSGDAGQWQRATALSQPYDHEGKQLLLSTILYTYDHSVFHFQHSIQKNNKRYSAPKVG